MSEQGEGPGIGKFKKALIGLGIVGATAVAADKGYLHDAPQEPTTGDKATSQKIEAEKKANPYLRVPVVNAEALTINGEKTLVNGITVIPGTEKTQKLHYAVKAKEGSSVSAFSEPNNGLDPVDFAKFGVSPDNGFVAHPVYGEPDERSPLSNPVLNTEGEAFKTAMYWEVTGKNETGEKVELFFPGDSLVVTDTKPVINVDLTH